MARVVLLVIDVQVACFQFPGAPIVASAALVARLAELVGRSRQRRVPVVYTRHVGSPDGPLALGAPTARIREEIAPRPEDIVIEKEHSDAFLDSELHDRLQQIGAETLVVCGLQTEFCVDTTCRRAHGLGYDVRLVGDAHGTADSATLTAGQIVAHHNATLGRAYAAIVSSGDAFP